MTFDTPGLLAGLEALTIDALDDLSFGVVGLDASGRVERYNAYESALSGLAPERVKGKHFFTAIAPCMNSPMLAGQLRDAERRKAALDDSLDFVLAFRSGPVPARVRLLFDPTVARRYIAFCRAQGV